MLSGALLQHLLSTFIPTTAIVPRPGSRPPDHALLGSSMGLPGTLWSASETGFGGMKEKDEGLDCVSLSLPLQVHWGHSLSSVETPTSPPSFPQELLALLGSWSQLERRHWTGGPCLKPPYLVSSHLPIALRLILPSLPLTENSTLSRWHL